MESQERTEPRPFVVVWRVAVAESGDRLTATQAAILHAVGTYMRPIGATALPPKSPGCKAIARRAHLTERAVEKNMPRLIDSGMLTIVSRPHTQHLYAGVIPEEVAGRLLEIHELQSLDLDAYERFGAGFVGPGVNELVAVAAPTRQPPLANLVRQGGEPRSLGGEPRSPEVEQEREERTPTRPARSVARVSEPRDVAALRGDLEREEQDSLAAGVLAGVARRRAALETHGPLARLLAMLPDSDAQTPKVLHALYDPLGAAAVDYAIRELEAYGPEVESPSAYAVAIAKRLSGAHARRGRFGRRRRSGRDELADFRVAEEQWQRIEARAAEAFGG